MSVEVLGKPCPVVAMQSPICTECKTKESAFWHRTVNNDVICNVCHDNRQEGVVTRTLRSQVLQSGSGAAVANSSTKSHDDTPSGTENSTSNTARSSGSNLISSTRKSNRLKPVAKARAVQSALKPSLSKGRSRRAVLKKNPLKAPTAVSTIVPSDYIFFEGNYWQVGDIVSVTDDEDGQTYYAQLRGFLQDQYCSKSAVLTWLIPTGRHIDHGCDQLPPDFDPNFYVAGPEEDLPRDMSHFEFVCHAPSDYFNRRSVYCSRVQNPPALGCVWTRFGPEIQNIGSTSDVESEAFGLCGYDSDARVTRSDVDSKSDREVGKRASLSRDKGQSNKVTVNRLKEKVTK